MDIKEYKNSYKFIIEDNFIPIEKCSELKINNCGDYSEILPSDSILNWIYFYNLHVQYYYGDFDIQHKPRDTIPFFVVNKKHNKIATFQNIIDIFKNNIKSPEYIVQIITTLYLQFKLIILTSFGNIYLLTTDQEDSKKSEPYRFIFEIKIKNNFQLSDEQINYIKIFMSNSYVYYNQIHNEPDTTRMEKLQYIRNMEPIIINCPYKRHPSYPIVINVPDFIDLFDKFVKNARSFYIRLKTSEFIELKREKELLEIENKKLYNKMIALKNENKACYSDNVKIHKILIEKHEENGRLLKELNDMDNRLINLSKWEIINEDNH